VGLPVPPGANRSESWPHAEPSVTSLVGREDVLSELLRSIGDAARGQSGAVIVSGEAGIGKTKLIETVIDEARLRGLAVLHGQCPDLQNPRPYHAFIQALWERISASSHRAEGTPASLSALLRTLGPDSGEGVRIGSTEVSSEAYGSAVIVEAFLNLLVGGVSEERPTLLVLDDIHRIDGASGALLVTLLGRLSKQKLFVLLTMRSDDPRARTVASGLIAGGAREIQLQPLSQTGIRKLTRSVLQANTVSADVARYVWERSNGIPLFAIELLKYLHAEGLIEQRSGRYWVLSETVKTAEIAGGIPSRIQEIVRRRIEALDPEVRRVLLVSAVFATEVYFEILKDAVAKPEGELADACEDLVSLRFLRETEHGFQFSHELTRHVAASMLGRGRLRVVHARVAKLIERRMPAHVEDLAWHFEMAGNVEKGLIYAEASGDKARSVHANVDAAAWYSKALALQDKLYPGSADHLRVRAGLLQKRQDVLDLLGDRDRQAADVGAIYAIAQQLSDKRLLGESLTLRANLLIRLNAAGEAMKCARLACRHFSEIGDAGGVARSHEAVGLAYENLRRYSAASAEFRRAQKVFRRIRDRAGEARVLIRVGTCLGYSNQNASALKCLNKAGPLLERLGDRRDLAMVFLQKGILWRFLGKLRTSEFLISRGVSIYREIGDRVGEARGLGQLAVTHAAMGMLRDAVHECESALRTARQAGDVRALIVTLNNSAYGVHRLAGNFVRAQRYIREALQLVSQGHNSENPVVYEDTAAAVLLDAGRPSEALRWARRGEARYAAVGSRNWLGIEIYLRLGAILGKLGQLREARRSLQLAQRHLARSSEPGTELLIAAEMAGIFLDLGNLKAAAKCEGRISRLLGRVDGVERIQKVYWTQFCVLKRTGRRGAAARALRRAVAAIVRQAGTLRKPMRRRFLTVPLNRDILREFWSSSHSSGTSGTAGTGVEDIVSVLAEHLGPEGSDLILPVESSVDSVIAARRRVVLGLIQKGRVRQRELARQLGVSVRTVRSDIAGLRKQGLLASSVN